MGPSLSTLVPQPQELSTTRRHTPSRSQQSRLLRFPAPCTGKSRSNTAINCPTATTILPTPTSFQTTSTERPPAPQRVESHPPVVSFHRGGGYTLISNLHKFLKSK